MPEQEITHEPDTGSQITLDTILRGDLSDVLNTESFEIASDSLDELQARVKWREEAQKSSISPFYQLFEGASIIHKAAIPDNQKNMMIQQLTDRLLSKTRSMSPRVRDLYIGLLAEIDGRSESFSPEFPMTEKKLETLREAGDLNLLVDPSVSYAIKQNRIETRLTGELMGRKALDRREGKVQESTDQDSKKQEKTKQKSKDQNQDNDQDENYGSDGETSPPPDLEESKPGMDEMERLKEGEEAHAIWTISPAYGGYYKQQSFDHFDQKKKVWQQTGYDYHPLATSFAPQDNSLTIRSKLTPNTWVRIPVPYTYQINKADNANCSIEQDRNGDCRIRLNSNKAQPVEISLITRTQDNLIYAPPKNTIEVTASLSDATESELEKIKTTCQTTVDKAHALASYTMRHLTYSQDSSFNTLYEHHPDGYLAAIDQFRKADCDVANTYFALLSSKLGIPVRHVVGDMIKNKDSDGNARITSGTGHAWSEIWDEKKKTWIRIDATPPGDPLQDREESENKQETLSGDYSDKKDEVIGYSDEELQQFEKQLSQRKDMLTYTSEERKLSQATGVELKEAREILKEIQSAENTTLPGGERIVDVLSQLFRLIIESRKLTVSGYTGPVRKREGGEEIEDIVAHKLGILSRDSDPASRQYERAEQKTEPAPGGFDVYLVGDKSNSMKRYTAEGKQKWEMQRKAAYLILSSLHRFQQNLSQAKPSMAEPLSVRTEMISFGKGTIDIDKPLSNEFTPSDKVTLWHSLKDQGPYNNDVLALSHIEQQIKDEIAEEEKSGKKDARLRIVIACSDGMPDSVEGVHAMAEALGNLNAVVVGIGLTKYADSIPQIYTTEHSRGDIAENINDLPSIVAKHIILEACKLFPEKSKQQYQRQIDTVLAKFKHH